MPRIGLKVLRLMFGPRIGMFLLLVWRKKPFAGSDFDSRSLGDGINRSRVGPGHRRRFAWQLHLSSIPRFRVALVGLFASVVGANLTRMIFDELWRAERDAKKERKRIHAEYDPLLVVAKKTKDQNAYDKALSDLMFESDLNDRPEVIRTNRRFLSEKRLLTQTTAVRQKSGLRLKPPMPLLM